MSKQFFLKSFNYKKNKWLEVLAIAKENMGT